MDILSDLDFKNTSTIKNLPTPIENGDGVPKSFLKNQKHKRQILTRSAGVGDSEANAIQLDSVQEEVTYFVNCFDGDVFLRLPSANISLSSENFPIRVQKIGFDYNRVIILAQPFRQILHPSINAVRNDLKISQPGDFVQLLAVDPETHYCVDFDRSVQSIFNSDVGDTQTLDITTETSFLIGINSDNHYDIQSAKATVTTQFGSTKVIRPKVAGLYKFTIDAALLANGTAALEEPRIRSYIYRQSTNTITEGTNHLFIQRGSTSSVKRFTISGTIIANLNGEGDYVFFTAHDSQSSDTRLSALPGTSVTVDLIRKTYDN